MKHQPSRDVADFAPDLPRPAVMCTIVKVVGSAPQGPGARMWVTRDGAIGTLGGGEFERQATARARGLLAASESSPVLDELVLCKQTGQCCGGRVSVFFEPVARRRTAHLFGGGHVGRALAEVLSGMPFDVVVVDPRPEWGGQDGLPAGVRAVCADPVEYARSREWGPEDAACVITHSHDLDFDVISELLERPAGYLGLIGSVHKADVFRARFAAKNLESLWDEKVRCPIGESFGGKSPKVIAVSIASELLKEWLDKASLAPRSGERVGVRGR